MSVPVFLERVFVRADATFRDGEFPGTLPFVRDLDLHTTKGILDHPERYWQHLARDEDA